MGDDVQNDWPQTDRPLRIAILGWARLSFQAHEGSGYNLAASELAAGLAAKGHEVSYLRSGMDYSLLPGMRTKHMEDWRGVRCYHLFNSPNLSPASSNFRNMPSEMNAPKHSQEVVRWLDEIKADVVHAHSLEGFGLDVVKAIRDSGRPVVITPHNYWFSCPQVDLLYEEKQVCMDYEGGNKCVGCLDAPSPGWMRFSRALEQTSNRTIGSFVSGLLKHTVKAVKRRLGLYEDKYTFTDADRAKPDPENSRGFEFDDAQSHPGTIDHGYGFKEFEKPVELGRSEIGTNERFLNADHHLTVLNNVYGTRRVKGIETLEASSLVTPPSRFMLRSYLTMGLDPSKGRHLRLGLSHFDQINRRVRRSPYYDVRPDTSSRPVRFAFNGTVRNNKGLEILLRAIERLDKDTRQRCHFLLRAGGWDWPLRKRMSKYPEVSFLGGYDPLQLIAAVGEYDVGILPHVWFENSPLVLLEHLHAGKFVISSRLGGPPEWVHEPDGDELGNGLLFAGGFDEALAECIRRIAHGEVTLPSPREIHEMSPLWSYPAHVNEAESIYCDLIDGRDAARPLELGFESKPIRTSEPARA